MPLPKDKVDFAGIAMNSSVVKSDGFFIYDIDSSFISESLFNVAKLQDIFGPTHKPFFAISSQGMLASGEPIFISSVSRTVYTVASDDDLEDGELEVSD